MMSQIEKTIKSLQRNNMAGHYVKDKEELLTLLGQLIPDKVTVGSGDSVTLEDLGVFDFLRSNDYLFHDKFRPGITSEEKRELYIKNFAAHTFITGTSAVSMDGKIFNIDGNGSRVAPTIYGPKQVIIVIGTNKLVSDEAAAIERTRQIAAVLDTKRLGKKTPCVELDRCIDCKSTERICHSHVLITGQFIKDRIKVVIVEGDWGF